MSKLAELIEKSVGTHTIITCCAVLPKYSTKAHDCMNFKQLLYKVGVLLGSFGSV
jgi:hypothetical protein